MSVADWIITVPVLVVILLAALGPDGDAPLTRRRSVYRRHAWAKTLREEEREGVRPPRPTRPPTSPSRGAEPQAKWSDRR